MTRQQIFQLVGMRPTTSQRVRLGAERDGRLVALGHDVTMHTSPDAEYAEQTAAAGAQPLRRAQPADAPPADAARPAARRGRPRAGRGAGPAGGRVGDGRAGRMRSAWIRSSCGSGTSPTVHPETRRAVQRPAPGRVHARRRAPVRLGAPPEQPGEPARGPVAGRLRDGGGDPHALPGADRRRGCGWAPDGTAVVQTDMTDIGTGTYTILTQVAAEALGLPLDRVRVELGRSDYPASCGLGRLVGRRQLQHRGLPRVLALREKLLAAALRRRALRRCRAWIRRRRVLRGRRAASAARPSRCARSSHATIPTGWRRRARSGPWDETRTTRPTRSTPTGRISPKCGVDADTGGDPAPADARRVLRRAACSTPRRPARS